MVAFFSSWAQGIIVAVIVATIVELLLPNGSSKKYVKVVVGIYILFSIIAPVVNKFANQDINAEIFTLEKKMEDCNNKILQKIEANNSRTVKDIYVANLEADLKAKLKDKGYEVTSTYIKAKDDENYTIENISITVKKNENKENKNEISIGEITISKTKDNTTSNEDISRQDKQEIKEYLAKTYDISEKIIDIN